MWQSTIVSSATGKGRRQQLTPGRHPTRRDGAIALALLLMPLAAWLALERRHHHVDTATVGILVTVALGLPALWLAWATYRESHSAEDKASKRSLRQIADELAVAVAAQWEAEAKARGLNDPYPLPVSWVAADASLADDWKVLETLATSGAGWPTRPSPSQWAGGPGELAGSGRELAKVLERVPTRRLVVLGEPGSGKTMLMVRLVLDLLTDRAKGDPVPILVPLASWNPARQDLHDWLVARLTIDHAALAREVGSRRISLISELLLERLIMPVLDGLDEMPEEARGQAFARINDALQPGEPVVVTCRGEPYRETVRSASGGLTTVRAAAVIELQPLEARTVADYLLEDAGGPAASKRWDPVLATLGTQTPTGQALVTPLMVGLARAIYNWRPGERATSVGDPAELCGLPDRTAVEAHLFDAFIPACYRQAPDGDRWGTEEARKWLEFLARHLEYSVLGPDLAWWQLALGIRSGFLRLAVGIVGGLAAGLAAGLPLGVGVGRTYGLAYGLAFGLLLGLPTGVVFGLIAGLGAKPARRRAFGWATRPSRLGFSSQAFALWLVAGLLFGLMLGIESLQQGRPRPTGLWIGSLAGFQELLFFLVLGLVFGLAAGLVFGLTGVPSDLTEAASPSALLSHDRRAALAITIAVALVLGLFAGLVAGPVAGLVTGLAAGPVAGILFSSFRAAWASYVLSRCWLAMHRRLPWRLMGFLADAHQRGVLRQVGSVYQFRHIDLQHRLAMAMSSQTSLTDTEVTKEVRTHPWGPGPFENDDASDFIDSLMELPANQRAEQILAALKLPDGHVQAPQALTAVAAAGLVAVANEMPFEAEAGLIDDIVRLAHLVREMSAGSRQVRDLVGAALSRATARDSEWRDLWDDADQLARARAALDQIRASL
jgi:hypothetical protein